MCDCDCELPKREKWRQVIQGETDRLVRKLEDLRRDRGRPHHHSVNRVVLERQAGELNGLDMAIRALKGHL